MDWWILFSIFVTTLYIGVVAYLLPKVFLRNKYKVNYPQDRGIVKYNIGEEGRGIAYEPNRSVRKYIQQYVIAFDGKEKNIKCMLTNPVDYIEYDLVLFNGENKVFNVLNVKDVVEGGEYTRSVTLPKDTAYVSFVIVKVDDVRLDKHVKLHISWWGVIAYAIISLILSVITAFVLKLGLANSFAGVFAQSFMNNLVYNLLTFLLAFVLAIIAITAAAIFLAIKNTWKK